MQGPSPFRRQQNKGPGVDFPMRWSQCLLSLELCAARPTYQLRSSHVPRLDGPTERLLPLGPITCRIPKVSPLAASRISSSHPALSPLSIPRILATRHILPTSHVLDARKSRNSPLQDGLLQGSGPPRRALTAISDPWHDRRHLTRRKEWCETVPIRWRPSVGIRRSNHPRTTPPAIA